MTIYVSMLNFDQNYISMLLPHCGPLSRFLKLYTLGATNTVIQKAVTSLSRYMWQHLQMSLPFKDGNVANILPPHGHGRIFYKVYEAILLKEVTQSASNQLYTMTRRR